MFYVTERAKYSDLDCHGVFKVCNFFSLFQDTSIAHTMSLNLPENPLYTRYVWILTEWQLEINQLPHLEEKMEIFTAPYSNKGFFSKRFFYIPSDDNSIEYMVKADTNWILYDTQEKRTTRVDDKDFPYELFAPIEMKTEKQKFWVQAKNLNFEKIMEINVDSSMIDTNLHVNNTQYIQTLFRYYTDMQKANRIRVVYKNPLYLNDSFIAYKSALDGDDIIVIKNQKDEECVFLKFSYPIQN